jgi:DNA segregation ATPase FtsK/SpoIIIE-like protein
LAQVREPVGIVGIDCFGSELNAILEWEKLMFPVARDLSSAALTLQAVTQEIAQRKALYADLPMAYDLPSYNRLAAMPLKPIVMLVDEGTAMLNEPGIADPLRQVVQTARQFGVYALLAGQNVNHRVMPTQTRDNFSTRLCFHTSAASRHVVLGETPDDVTVKGRAWVQRPGEMLRQIQCPFVTREEVERVVVAGKPARVLDLEAIQPENQGDEAARITARIRALKTDGASLNHIQREVFGYTGGKAYSAVKAALG